MNNSQILTETKIAPFSPNMEPLPIRISLTDDEETSFILIRHLLAKVPGKKFIIEWAANFDAGLRLIQEKRHDLHLIDYRLGSESGLDLLRQAVALGTQAPIIILTGSDDPAVDLEATQLGAADFLIKDKLDPSTLERSIRYAIQHFATLRELQRSNQQFRLLFERSLDAILIYNDDEQFTAINSAASQLTGYPRKDLIGLKISELFSPHPKVLMEWRRNGFGELTFVRPDGARRVVEFSASNFAPNLNLSIVRDITERRILEKEILEISEREQRRLGQDLHDDLGQSLTGISFLAKVLQNRLTAAQIPEAKNAEEIATLLNEALQQTRSLSRGLCPVVLESNDIAAALQQLVENLQSIFSVSAELACDPELKIVDNQLAVHLYRIAQEATTNAIKHGQATKIHISLLRNRSRLTLRVKDNGIGYDKSSPDKKGMGLRVMHHRAGMIGGTLDIKPLSQRGTVVTCSVRKNHY